VADAAQRMSRDNEVVDSFVIAVAVVTAITAIATVTTVDCAIAAFNSAAFNFAAFNSAVIAAFGHALASVACTITHVAFAFLIGIAVITAATFVVAAFVMVTGALDAI